MLALKRSLGRRDACPTFGDGSEPGLKRYSCWCPKVIAMIGRVPDTIGDRSIVVQMSRKLVSEACAPLSELNALEIRAKCVRFALDAGPAIAAAARVRVEGLNDRAADTFDPLYVIARLAGGGWEERLHQAALGLAASAQSEHSGTAMLLDILTIFAVSGCPRILSRNLVEVLRGGFGGLISTALDYSSLNEYRMAQMLQPYGIRSSSIRIGKVVRRGYAETDFLDAIKRYVPKAEVEARMEEIRRRSELHREARAEAEAQAEAEQQAAMIEVTASEKARDIAGHNHVNT